MATQKKTVEKTKFINIAENRRARYDYNIADTYECGIVLLGTEVKSLRARHINFSDAYALLKDSEVFLIGLKIEPYVYGTHVNHNADRTRKLLLHKKEIKKIQKEIQKKSSTLIPLKLYFRDGRVKVLLAIAQGKSKIDKRENIKKRDAEREVSRVMRRG
jgi:SsrA-binding protein